MTILECPVCYSHRASVLETRPPTAKCADCDSTYKITTVKPHDAPDHQEERPPPKKRRKRQQPDIKPTPPIKARDIGILSDFINDALQRGPEGLRDAQREATRYARKFGLTYLEPQWFVETPWLKDWAEGNIVADNNHRLLANGSFVLSAPNKRGQSESRLRVRAAISWRAGWLCNYALSGSIVIACRKAKISEQTFYYHKRNDKDFAEMAEAAKAHCIDLLHARCMQRSLEGDLEPVFWQGIEVGRVRKFDSRLQIELLRAHMPATFKTPGTAPINIDTGDKILVLTEERRAKLMAARRRALEAMPGPSDSLSCADSAQVTSG